MNNFSPVQIHCAMKFESVIGNLIVRIEEVNLFCSVDNFCADVWSCGGGPSIWHGALEEG